MLQPVLQLGINKVEVFDCWSACLKGLAMLAQKRISISTAVIRLLCKRGWTRVAFSAMLLVSCSKGVAFPFVLQVQALSGAASGLQQLPAADPAALG
jgi:hypothetical protein